MAMKNSCRQACSDTHTHTHTHTLTLTQTHTHTHTHNQSNNQSINECNTKDHAKLRKST